MKRLRDDAGFTLIELLITMVIVATITAPLDNLVIEYFSNTVATQNRAAVSHDQQLATTYFAEDVASLGRHAADGTTKQSVWTTSTGIPYACGSGLSVVVVLAWDEYSSAGVLSTSEAVYGTRSVTTSGSTELQLVRQHCSNSSSTPDFVSVVAHKLTAAPTVSCDGASCAGATYPQSVSLTMTLAASTAQTPTTVTLVGQRRQT